LGRYLTTFSTIFNGISTAFFQANIDFLPVVALPVLDAVVPLTSTREHMSWGAGNSTEVRFKICISRKTTILTFFVKIAPGSNYLQ
jgi:hypothetical protein